MNLVATNSTIEDLFNTAPTATQVVFRDDPIVLSCASYRMWINNGIKFMDLDSVTPVTEDRVRAEALRNYYRARITWQMLQARESRPISEFQRKLMGIIEGTLQITTAELGILYRINYFYDEDLAHDEIFEHRTFTVLPNTFTNRRGRFVLNREVSVTRRQYKNTEYWLDAVGSDVPCMITVQQDNTLRPLLASVLKSGPVELVANWHPKALRGQAQSRHYYRLTAVELA